MARKVHVHLIDDLDGSTADETVKFGLDGVAYEIDLTSDHARELRAALDRYVGVASKISPDRSAGAVRGRRPGGVSMSADRAQNKAIREWAKRKNIKLNDRGRIPQRIAEQYEAEAGR